MLLCNSLQLHWPSSMCLPSEVKSQKPGSKCLTPVEILSASLKQQERRSFEKKKKKRSKWTKNKSSHWKLAVKYLFLFVQAVRETALSRAALFGTTAAVPNLMVLLLQRTRPFQRNSLLAAPLRHISVAFVLGLMIPVSFSLFPQLGTIRKENVEQELRAAADNGQLYYHRGLWGDVLFRRLLD